MEADMSKRTILLGAAVGLGLAMAVTARAQEYYYCERITPSKTLGMVHDGGSRGPIVFELQGPGNGEFGERRKAIEYEHSVRAIQPPLLPHSNVRRARISLHLSSLLDDRDFEVHINSEAGHQLDDAMIELVRDAGEYMSIDATPLREGTILVSLHPGADADDNDDAYPYTARFKLVGSKLEVWYAPAVTTGGGEPEAKLPRGFAPHRNDPNPFDPTLTMDYALGEPGHVSLVVCNSAGEEVRTLVETRQSAGRHLAEWDGRDEAGISLASGTYFYRLDVNGRRATRKIILVN
jgi:hypothetical protein